MLFLDLSASRLDLRPGARAQLHATDDHGLRNVAVGEQFRGTLVVLDEAGRHERVTRDLRTRGHARQILERDLLRLDPERRREAALGQTPCQRHLAALEMRLAAARTAVTRARLAALVSLAGRLAGAGARPATQPLAIAM